MHPTRATAPAAPGRLPRGSTYLELRRGLLPLPYRIDRLKFSAPISPAGRPSYHVSLCLLTPSSESLSGPTGAHDGPSLRATPEVPTRQPRTGDAPATGHRDSRPPWRPFASAAPLRRGAFETPPSCDRSHPGFKWRSYVQLRDVPYRTLGAPVTFARIVRCSRRRVGRPSARRPAKAARCASRQVGQARQLIENRQQFPSASAPAWRHLGRSQPVARGIFPPRVDPPQILGGGAAPTCGCDKTLVTSGRCRTPPPHERPSLDAAGARGGRVQAP